MLTPRRTGADRFLELSLLAALLVHGVALFTMALFLLPGVPGAGLSTPDLRFAYIHAHPILWHVGWFPWHLSALSDLFLSAALVRARWIAHYVSIPTVLLTIVAFVMEQFYETRWDVLAPTHSANYAAFEHRAFIPVTCIAAGIYAVMAMGWSWSLSFAPAWTRLLTAISCLAWPILLFASVTPLLPFSLRVPYAAVNAANQAGFTLMMAFFALALETVLRRTRIDEPVGRMAPWRAPRPGIAGSLEQALANSRLLQYLAEFLPTPVLSSDIHDVVYLNYLVDAERMAALLPAGLKLQTLGPADRFTLFSILVYRHGRFGPRILGGGTTCRGFPSPVQSNWRLYVSHAASGQDGIFFVSTTLSKLPAALIARTLSRGVPMHTPDISELAAAYPPAGTKNQPITAHLSLQPRQGSAPDLSATLTSLPGSPALPPGAWRDCFHSYQAFLEYAVPQGRALSVQSWDGRVTAQEIDLPAQPAQCVQLDGITCSEYVRTLCGDVQPICFLLPEVHFSMIGERTLQPGSITPDKA